ncbi:MAG: hypothetical protein ABSG45_05675 [Nitrososphaerales archaeon]
MEVRLVSNGYSVRTDGERLRAESGSGKITIVRSGLARSAGELLDALAPALPELLLSPRKPASVNPYFVAKSLHLGFEVQFFPRMEGLRLWTALRRAGECGLTPDEKAVVSQVLHDVDQPLDCVTDYPTEGCTVLQVEKNQYFHSLVPADEFVSRLRTISSTFSKNCYLPRSSIIRVKARSLPSPSVSDELGEWCYLRFTSKSL